MDDYPEHLAPEFETPRGALKTTFEEWWPRVKEHFRNVPEEAARYWLYQHWSHSPYKYLKSASYDFARVAWRSHEMIEIVSRWCNFDPKNVDCLAHGRHLVEDDLYAGYRYKTAVYMTENGDFPTPIVVLDNRDDHLGKGKVAEDWQALPKSFVLIEGHRRFDIALYLDSTARLKPCVDVWLMTHKA
jgi:hypothetical protein